MAMIQVVPVVPPVFLGPDFFPLLGIGSFSPLSACALRWSFGTVSFKRKGGGGGGGDRGVPKVGLFNLYRVHFKRYQESWEVPLWLPTIHWVVILHLSTR